MRPKQPAAHDGAAFRPSEPRPGSRSARLGEAGKQLEILLEDVDIDEEPTLAEALTDAVSATARANDHVGDDGSARRSGAGAGTMGDRGVETATREPTAPLERRDRDEESIQAGGVAFVRRAGEE